LEESLGVALVVAFTGDFKLIFAEARGFAGFAVIFLLFKFSFSLPGRVSRALQPVTWSNLDSVYGFVKVVTTALCFHQLRVTACSTGEGGG